MCRSARASVCGEMRGAGRMVSRELLENAAHHAKLEVHIHVFRWIEIKVSVCLEMRTVQL